MRFFERYPKTPYVFGTLPTEEQFTNLTVYSNILDEIKDDATAYTFYDVRDGERPDIVSSKLYKTPIYDWTFFLLNDHIRLQGWPLSYQDFRDFIEVSLPGKCLVFNGTDTHSVSGLTVHNMTEKFKVGDTVIGNTSNASGTVYMRNLNLGQIFVNQTTAAAYSAGETVTDSLALPTQNLTLDATMRAYEAIHHYLDGDGQIADIDPTTGIVPVGYTAVTHEEHLEAENDKLSRIRVLQPNLITQFASLYQQAINN